MNFTDDDVKKLNMLGADASFPHPRPSVPASALVLISHFFVFPNSHLAWSHIFLQGLPNLSLVAIDSSTINMTVTYAKGMLDGCFHLPEGKGDFSYTSRRGEGGRIILRPPMQVRGEKMKSDSRLGI